MTETTTLPCAVCRKALEAMDGDVDAPYAANIFTAEGNYGSTAFDTFGGEHLELFICTDCLKIMQANSAIHRVFQATEEIPEQTFVWGSAEDPATDNPWNRQRLRNEFAMEEYLEAAEDMTQKCAGLIFAACTEASRAGKVFDPASIPAPKKEELTNVQG
jgi:hypothetical protein